MAARVIPFENNAADLGISIDSTLTPSHQACIITPPTTGVTFTNNSGAPINITFEPSPLTPPTPPAFNNVANLDYTPGNNSITLPALVTSGFGLYNISSGAATNGPFAIQVGQTGYLTVQVVYNSALGMPQATPGTVAMPIDGNLQMVSGDGNTYSVSWPDGDPFSPAISQINPTGNTPSQEDLSALVSYRYFVQKVSPLANTTNGGGKVIVRNG